MAGMNLGIQIKDLQQLEFIMTKIRRIKVFIQFIVCVLLVEDNMRSVIQRCNWCRVLSEGRCVEK